jgi:SAM-dependent methyltransferase
MEKYKKETINSYNQNAEALSEKFKRLTDVGRRKEFQKFIDLLSGKDILDLGCGAGDHSKYFVGKGLNVTCIDISEEMIKLCKEKGLNAFVMDIEDLKFSLNSFDGIWAVTSLLHIPKSKIYLVIDKLYQILKEDGIIHICVKEGDGERLVKDKYFDSQRFFSFWRKDEILKLFEEKFSFIEFERVKLGNTDFLHFFFRKKNNF